MIRQIVYIILLFTMSIVTGISTVVFIMYKFQCLCNLEIVKAASFGFSTILFIACIHLGNFDD